MMDSIDFDYEPVRRHRACDMNAFAVTETRDVEHHKSDKRRQLSRISLLVMIFHFRMSG